MEGCQPSLLDEIEIAFAYQISALPVVTPVEHHHHFAFVDSTQGLFAVSGAAGYPEPQYIHGRAECVELKAGLLTHNGLTPVGSDHKISAHIEYPFGRFYPDASDPSFFLDQVDNFGTHSQLE